MLKTRWSSKKTPNPRLAILLAGVWINACEFVRNEWLLRSHWEEHFRSLGREFPSTHLNAGLWVAWGFALSALLGAMLRHTEPRKALFLGWCFAFPMMWIVTWNLGVLPLSILPFAIPLSWIEIGGAGWLLRRFLK